MQPAQALPPEKFSSYQRFTIALLALLQFLVMLDFMIIAPLGHILTKDLNIGTSRFGIVVSVYIFSAAAASFFSSGFLDRYDRKKILLFFFSGFIIGTVLCALSNSFLSLLVARIVTGIFGGVIGSIIMTIVTDLFSPTQRGRAMSTIQTSFAVAQILGIPLGLFIATHLNWNYTFYLIVLLSLLILFVITLRLKPIDGHLVSRSDKNPFLHLWHTLKNKKHLVGFSATVILGMSMMLQPFISLFLVNNIHLRDTEVPLVFMATGIAFIFIMPLVGKLSDKFDRFKFFTFGSLATIIITLVYTHLSAASFWMALSLNVIMSVFIISRMGPFQALNSMLPEPAYRGAYMSLSSAFQQMAGGLGIAIAGAIVFQESPASPLQNFDVLGYLVTALSLISIFLVSILKRSGFNAS